MTRPIFARGMGTSPAGPTGPAGAAGPAGPAGANGGSDASTADNVANGTATKAALSSAYAPKAATYASGVAYVVGQLVVSGTTLYRVTTAHTSSGSIDLSNFATAGGGGASSSAASTINFTASSLRRFRAAMGRALSGGTNAHIAFLGDSTTFGNALTDAQSLPSRFRDLVAAAGVPARGTGILPAIQLQGSTARNPIVTSSGISDLAIGAMSAGGFLSGGSGGSITIASPNVSKFVVYYVRWDVAGGTTTPTIDGSPVAAIDSTFTSKVYAKVEYAVSPGAHTLIIPAAASGNIFIVGVEARIGGDTGGVRVSNFGNSGKDTTHLVSAQYDGSSALAGIDALAADLLLIDLGLNDGNGNPNAAVSPTAYAANLTTAITRQRATGGADGTGGDVVLVTFNPAQTGRFIQYPESAYIAKALEVATALDVAVVDIHDRWGSFAISQPLGYYQDGVHPTAAGYRDKASVEYEALRSVGVGL